MGNRTNRAPSTQPPAESGEAALQSDLVVGPPPTPDLTAPMFTGLAGEIVRAVLPETEADPVALLVQLLVAFGNALNRGPHYLVGATQHFCNLFALMIGLTNEGRKGTSWEWDRLFMKVADPKWEAACVRGGLSSGEGLVAEVSDSAAGEPPKDKRRLIFESEFGSVLRRMGREGNTLSPVLRQAWDGSRLTVMTKQQQLHASEAHISVVGHVTPVELRILLDKTDVAGGLVNRFLLLYVHRSKLLPHGGEQRRVPVEHFGKRIERALNGGRALGRMRRTADAGTLWERMYGSLSESRPGALGSVTSRAAPMVVRLSCVYAILDESREVCPIHLAAAYDLWRYSESCAEYVFGDSLGDALADRVLAALRQQLDEASCGMTATQLNNWFGRNVPKNELDRALNVLVENRLASFSMVPPTGPSGRGRPAQVWVANDPRQNGVVDLAAFSSFNSCAEDGKGEGNAEDGKRKNTHEINDNNDIYPDLSSPLDRGEAWESDELTPPDPA